MLMVKKSIFFALYYVDRLWQDALEYMVMETRHPRSGAQRWSIYWEDEIWYFGWEGPLFAKWAQQPCSLLQRIGSKWPSSPCWDWRYLGNSYGGLNVLLREISFDDNILDYERSRNILPCPWRNLFIRLRAELRRGQSLYWEGCLWAKAAGPGVVVVEELRFIRSGQVYLQEYSWMETSRFLSPPFHQRPLGIALPGIIYQSLLPINSPSLFQATANGYPYVAELWTNGLTFDGRKLHSSASYSCMYITSISSILSGPFYVRHATLD